jgi:hypothetical protein
VEVILSYYMEACPRMIVPAQFIRNQNVVCMHSSARMGSSNMSGIYAYIMLCSLFFFKKKNKTKPPCVCMAKLKIVYVHTLHALRLASHSDSQICNTGKDDVQCLDS